jgi:hypothetical protein
MATLESSGVQMQKSKYGLTISMACNRGALLTYSSMEPFCMWEGASLSKPPSEEKKEKIELKKQNLYHTL